MAEHDHEWQPIPNECRKFECTCGATGYRNSSGAIVEHKQKIARTTATTAGQSEHGAWLRRQIEKDYDGD